MRTLSNTPKFSDALPVPDEGLHRWFVITPSGHAVFVEDQVKAHALRKVYDDYDIGITSIYSESIREEEELIPF